MEIKNNFRNAMRKYIYSVSIFSNKSTSGDLNAITVSSVTSISMNPPSLLVCINKDARIHDTLLEGEEFCINLLTKKHMNLSNICSNPNRHDDRFLNDSWNVDNVPYLNDAQANIFCKIDKLISFNTHTIVIGLVNDAISREEINTLSYLNGDYA